jgi:SM-20-related protein
MAEIAHKFGSRLFSGLFKRLPRHQPQFQHEGLSSRLDIDKLAQTKLEASPYPHLILQDFIRPEWKERLLQAYPDIPVGGSLPLSAVPHSAEFSQFIAELNGPAFRRAIEEKFSVSLAGKPTMFTVRGHCRSKDGKAHTDSESKIITVLLYMNPPWQSDGGRLRILGSANLNDIVSEVSPEIGTLLVFKRSDHSWHGHLPFEGPRKVIQMNWVTEQKYVDAEHRRHRWSFFLKMLGKGGY